MMGLRESLIITEFISNETHLFRNNPMEPVHNLYIPSILCEFTHEIIVSSSTNHRDIKILKVLKKKKETYLLLLGLFETEEKTRKILAVRNETSKRKKWKSFLNPF